MRVGLIQFDIAWQDRKANKSKIEKILKHIKSIDWLIFPEMALTGFSMDSKFTEMQAGDLAFFQNLAVKYKAFISFGGVKNKKNCLITLNKSGEIINKYAKNHLFSYANEDKFYKAGKNTKPFKLGDYSITPTICYDLRFAPLYWAQAKKTDIYLNIANWPASRAKHWEALLKARAIENQAYIIGVNRVGKDPDLAYPGKSMIIGPQGETLLEIGSREGCFLYDFPKEKLVKEVRKEYPFLKDRV
ncbi:nitrilase-related carbon-nitrogen hydrolase [Candidatus Margulisiibacteriota bacterium]